MKEIRGKLEMQWEDTRYGGTKKTETNKLTRGKECYLLQNEKLIMSQETVDFQKLV